MLSVCRTILTARAARMGLRMRTQAKSVETEVGEGRTAVEAQQQESKLASKLVDTRWREALEISIDLRYAQARLTRPKYYRL